MSTAIGEFQAKENFDQDDQICPAIALLEIEHKKFPVGGIFQVHSK
jgi:hypothetical protein